VRDLGRLSSGLLSSLCAAYADFLRRQRSAGSAMSTWSRANARRAPEFSWLGGAADPREQLMTGLGDLRITSSHPCLGVVGKMSATIQLNPYEREALYGYPFVVGMVKGKSVRAPLLTVPVAIKPEGRGYVVSPEEDTLEFNPLPFLGEDVSDARDLAVARITAAIPPLPLTEVALRAFLDVVERELGNVTVAGAMDGRLDEPPEGPGNAGLRIIDCAAVLIAPQASYFLASDLDALAEGGAVSPQSPLVPLLGGAEAEAQVDVTEQMEASARVYFPFASNRAQRRAAILLDHPSTRVLRIDGPPGTGKSLTVANLVAHIVATGRTVLVTSTKDKALSVVDEKLKELQSPLLPMTLLHRNKAPLLERLALITKSRSRSELDQIVAAVASEYAESRGQYGKVREAFARSIEAEEQRVAADHRAEGATGLKRLAASWRRHSAWRRAHRHSPQTTAEMSALAQAARARVFAQAQDFLRASAEHRTASESRLQKQNREELAKTVRRNQTSYRNYPLFDRLKKDIERARMLLQSLPAWVMTPDDVARLFPCEEGLFDVVIVDEASQVDLPSILPILHRGRKIVLCGDLRQMQPRRFAFVADSVARGVWAKHRVGDHDPDGLYHPTRQSLLDLGASRSEESVFLDEHFRCLPSIIAPSNERFYQNQLRVMTDETRKQFGSPTTAAFTLHNVEGGSVTPGSQVNDAEARALVDTLGTLLGSPEYAGASFGVIALFEEQMRLLQDMVTEEVDAELWQAHNLVVVNPDGFQGDERDVILYSLSYDAEGMTQQQLSARMVDQPHIMGMLNVMWTRPRHEVHIFHTAPISEFTYAGRRPSPLSEWLKHAAEVHERGRVFYGPSRVGMVDSEFEAQVSSALQQRGYTVQSQYPACGFWIDLVVSPRQNPSPRLAVECDGERWHLDEHGEQKLEDLEREEILERAGWSVARIPYSRWRTAPEAELQRIDAWFQSQPAKANAPSPPASGALSVESDAPPRIELAPLGRAPLVTDAVEWSVIEACSQDGRCGIDEVLRRAARVQGAMRLGSRIRAATTAAAHRLAHKGLLAIEEDEWFLTAAGRRAVYSGRPVRARLR
jgi:very-short-patch-repair endonuclease